MSKIIDMTGSDLKPRFYICCKCQAELWGDHGWMLEDGSIVCRREDKCHQRSISNKIEQEKAAGVWNPPWRR